MSKQNLTHWKKLQNPNYLGSYSLQPGEEKVLTIKYVAEESVTGSDGRKEELPVMHFVENVKPMVLNVTNSKTIEKLAKTPYIEEWGGVRIQLYVAEVRAFGEVVDALRIRPIAPQDKKQYLTPRHKELWNRAKLTLSKEETTLEAIKERFALKPEHEKELKSVIPNA